MAIQPTGQPPQVTALAPQPASHAMPQGGGGFEQLRQGWTQFFQKPETISALLQFGATMLTPGSGGIGPALSAGAQAAGRVVQARGAQQAAQAKMGLEERKLSSSERIAERRLQGQEARERSTDRRAEARLGMEERKLERQAEKDRQAQEMQRRRLEEYLIPSLRRQQNGKTLSIEDRMLNTVYRGWAERASLEPLPEGVDPNTWAMERTLEEINSIAGIQKKLASGEPLAPAEEAPEEEGPGLMSRVGSAISGAFGGGGGVQQAGGSDTSGPMPSGQGAAPAQPAGGIPAPPPAVGDSGLPSPETIQDAQWLQIAQDPQAMQEAVQAWGEGAVQRRIMVAQQRARGTSIGEMRRNQGQ